MHLFFTSVVYQQTENTWKYKSTTERQEGKGKTPVLASVGTHDRETEREGRREERQRWNDGEEGKADFPHMQLFEYSVLPQDTAVYKTLPFLLPNGPLFISI